MTHWSYCWCSCRIVPWGHLSGGGRLRCKTGGPWRVCSYPVRRQTLWWFFFLVNACWGYGQGPGISFPFDVLPSYPSPLLHAIWKEEPPRVISVLQECGIMGMVGSGILKFWAFVEGEVKPPVTRLEWQWNTNHKDSIVTSPVEVGSVFQQNTAETEGRIPKQQTSFILTEVVRWNF